MQTKKEISVALYNLLVSTCGAGIVEQAEDEDDV